VALLIVAAVKLSRLDVRESFGACRARYCLIIRTRQQYTGDSVTVSPQAQGRLHKRLR
jgi:hypothetical protein